MPYVSNEIRQNCQLVSVLFFCGTTWIRNATYLSTRIPQRTNGADGVGSIALNTLVSSMLGIPEVALE